MNKEFMEKITGSDKPYQRYAFGCASYLKTYADLEKAPANGKSAYEEWCVVTVDDMIDAVKILMDDMEAEWNDWIQKNKATPFDMAGNSRQYLTMWFILQNLNDLKSEHGAFKHCADMVEPAEIIELDAGGEE